MNSSHSVNKSDPTPVAAEHRQALTPLHSSGGNPSSSAAAEGNLAMGNGVESPPLACILAIGTANPERVLLQSDYPDMLIRTIQGYSSDPCVPDLARKIAKQSGITTRHMAVMPDEYSPNMLKHGAPSLKDRQELWMGAGIKLGTAAVEKALQEWGCSRSHITHLVAVSVSGSQCPGIDLHLIAALGLPQSTKHTSVSCMGCDASLIGLRLAADIALSSPGRHRVMMVVIEVNSVNGQVPEPGNPMNNIITGAMYGDGAAAIILGAKPTADEKSVYEIHRTQTTYFTQPEEVSVVFPTHHGLDVLPKRNMPQIVASKLDSFIHDLVGDMDYESLLWVLHLGGKALLDTVERTCRLPSNALQPSRELLDCYGVMTACQVPFLMDQVRRKNGGPRHDPFKDYVVALATGPGLNGEAALLRLGK